MIVNPQTTEPADKEPINTSPNIGKLIAALAAARNKFEPIVKDTENPLYHSKYATLDSIFKATKTALSEQGIEVIQFPVSEGKTSGVITILAHSSGEYIISPKFMVPAVGYVKGGGERFDAQTACMAITYACRYAYSAAVGVASEVDDDGHAASHSQNEQKPKQFTKVVPTENPKKPINLGVGMPTQVQLGKYFQLAGDLTQSLGIDGLKLKTYFLAVTGATELNKITVTQWETLFSTLDSIKGDKLKTIELIESKQKGEQSVGK